MRPLVASQRGEISRLALSTTTQPTGVKVTKSGSLRIINWTKGSGSTTLGFIVPGTSYYIPRECIAYIASQYYGTVYFDNVFCFSNSSATSKNITNLTAKGTYTISLFSASFPNPKGFFKINKTITANNIYTFTI